MDDCRKRIREVLDDYRDGLGDGLDEAVEEIMRVTGRGQDSCEHDWIDVTTMEESEGRFRCSRCGSTSIEDPRR